MTKFKFVGTEIHSKDYTKRFFFYSTECNLWVDKDRRGYEHGASDQMFDVSVVSGTKFEVIEETKFNGKITVKHMEVEELGEEDEVLQIEG